VLLIVSVGTSTDINSIIALEVPREFVERIVGAKMWFERLVRSFDVLPAEELKHEQTDFQQVILHWAKVLEEGRPLTMFDIMTANYPSLDKPE
tara:strand:- start:914 stop:1192 length:279 start_codon:yes stop_codon:yes gene_type:complete